MSVVPISIRPATVHDLPRILALYRAGVAPGGESPDSEGGPEYERAFAEIDADPNLSLVVAESHDVVVGTLHFSCVRQLHHHGGRTAGVESVHVAPEWRSRGIGAALMGWAVDEARRRGCFRVQLTSNKARLDAHRFYERLGFTASHEGMKLVL
jgi:predicted N-acetyltransferase YhbS